MWVGGQWGEWGPGVLLPVTLPVGWEACKGTSVAPTGAAKRFVWAGRNSSSAKGRGSKRQPEKQISPQGTESCIGSSGGEVTQIVEIPGGGPRPRAGECRSVGAGLARGIYFN